MTVFFTADTHFGHTNIIKHVGRPFTSVEDMDKTIIRNWNRAVCPTDTIYHLGDVSTHRPQRTREILHLLNGKYSSSEGITKLRHTPSMPRPL
jgi:calcineurin-like phosphoesterase family protein